MRIGPVVLTICALSCAACSAKNEPRKPASFIAAEAHITHQDRSSQMATLFPKDGDIPGWQRDAEMTLFDQGSLYRHINGAAGAFFAYGFQLCGSVTYIPGTETGEKTSSHEDEFIQIDVYDMGRAIHAFGMYGSENDPESEAVDIGAQGDIAPYALSFWKGPYYVKIATSTPEEGLSNAKTTFANHIAQHIPGKAEKPPMLSLLPTRRMVSGTEKFVLRDVLGCSSLKNGLMATYQVSGESKSLLIVVCESIDDAKDRFDRFLRYEEETGEGAVGIDSLGEEGFAAKDRYYDRLIAVRHGPYVMATLAVTNEEAARELIKEAIDSVNRQE